MSEWVFITLSIRQTVSVNLHSPLTRFKSQGVHVEEVQVDQKMKACLWGYRVVEDACNKPPDLEKKNISSLGATNH